MILRDQRLESFVEQFKPFDFKPYSVVCHFHTPPASYDNLHFDGILSKAIVECALRGVKLAPSSKPYWIPLPLKMAWRSLAGQPLWESTDFVPITSDSIQPGFWHKRGIRPELLKKTRGGQFPNFRMTQGALKEYRIPLPVHSCREWRASFVGDLDAICELLKRVGCIGKKRSQGYGIVKKWEIHEIANFTFFGVGINPLRPLPLPFLKSPEYLKTYGNSDWIDWSFTGWTPPYWLTANQQMCIDGSKSYE